MSISRVNFSESPATIIILKLLLDQVVVSMRENVAIKHFCFLLVEGACSSLVLLFGINKALVVLSNQRESKWESRDKISFNRVPPLLPIMEYRLSDEIAITSGFK